MSDGLSLEAAPVASGDATGPSKGMVHLYLQPGKLIVSSENVAVATVLGSCVSVCLWDGRRGRGGVNHYLLPHGADIGGAGTRFGNIALERLLDAMLGGGSRREDLRAKIFGGARISISPDAPGVDLGEKNIRVARKFLSHQEIRVEAET